jgi:hypothetical protein
MDSAIPSDPAEMAAKVEMAVLWEMAARVARVAAGSSSAMGSS